MLNLRATCQPVKHQMIQRFANTCRDALPMPTNLTIAQTSVMLYWNVMSALWIFIPAGRQKYIPVARPKHRVYFGAASMRTEGPGLETQSTFTPILLPHGIYFH